LLDSLPYRFFITKESLTGCQTLRTINYGKTVKSNSQQNLLCFFYYIAYHVLVQNKLPKPIKLRPLGTQLYGFWFVIMPSYLYRAFEDRLALIVKF